MSLHVATQGSGIDLVLLHGWGTNGSIWSELSAQLEDRFRLHCVDLPGCGESLPCTPYTLDALVENLAMSLPPKTHVCGWSLGGLVALQWALRYPAQVERVMLIATTPCFVRAPGWESGLPLSWFENFAAGLARDPRRTLRRFASLQAQGDAVPQVIRRLSKCMLEATVQDVQTLQAGLQILKDTDLRASLSRISQPVRILHGAADTIVLLAAGEYLCKALPHATLEVFAKTAHAPFIADAHRTAQVLREFLQ